MKRNNDLRLAIAEMVYHAGDGHIPSAYSIVEILAFLYGGFLRVDPRRPQWEDRDYFLLSKGHGCAALYVILQRCGFFAEDILRRTSASNRLLGGHPDSTLVPGVEASTGSLGHGIAIALGIALGLRIRKKKNRVVVLVGDGECNEGTVWESALVAANMHLGNLCVIVDENGSADQILPVNPLIEKWRAFGWETVKVDGHNEREMKQALKRFAFSPRGKPKAMIAHTIKGKGVPFLEGHGVWHSKVPSKEEMEKIRRELQ